jgi:hypothetical protein
MKSVVEDRAMKAVLCVCALLMLAWQLGWAGIVTLNRPSGIHIMSIGIGSDTSMQKGALNYSENDAAALANAFAIVASRLCPVIDKSILLGATATRTAIQDSMEAIIGRTRPEDIMVFYFAGRSSVDSRSQLYLYPSDASHSAYDTSRRNEAISGDLLKTWFARSPARNQLIILDAGRYSFDAFTSLVDEQVQSPFQRRKRNIVMLSSYPLGVELREWNHGALTLFLLEGLTGYAESFRGRGLISAWGLETYVARKLYEYSDTATGHKMRIASRVEGMDFNIGYAKHDTSALGGLLGSRGAVPLNVDTIGITAPPKPKPTHRALLFATNHYEHFDSLFNPIDDARAIAAELRDNYGFVTETVEDPPRDTIEARILKCMERTYADEDQLFVFIAGHGEFREELKQGYVIARDSKPRGDDLLRRTCIKHTDLRDLVDVIDCKHVLVMLDVCFGGTFDQRIRGTDEYDEIADSSYVVRKSKITSRWYLTSGGKEYVPDGRPGHHSPFVFKVIEALRQHVDTKKILTVAGLKSAVEKILPQPCMGEFGSYEPQGDFVFVPK